MGGCEGGRRTSPALRVFVADQLHLLSRRRRQRHSRRACGAALLRHLDGQWSIRVGHVLERVRRRVLPSCPQLDVFLGKQRRHGLLHLAHAADDVVLVEPQRAWFALLPRRGLAVQLLLLVLLLVAGVGRAAKRGAAPYFYLPLLGSYRQAPPACRRQAGRTAVLHARADPPVVLCRLRWHNRPNNRGLQLTHLPWVLSSSPVVSIRTFDIITNSVPRRH